MAPTCLRAGQQHRITLHRSGRTFQDALDERSGKNAFNTVFASLVNHSECCKSLLSWPRSCKMQPKAIFLLHAFALSQTHK